MTYEELRKEKLKKYKKIIGRIYGGPGSGRHAEGELNDLKDEESLRHGRIVRLEEKIKKTNDIGEKNKLIGMKEWEENKLNQVKDKIKKKEKELKK